jgi:hypothetical protein
MSGILEQFSADAFRERLQTAAIKREHYQRTAAPKPCDMEKTAVRRRIDDIKLAKELGIGLEGLK